jgi:hypothetical protein
MSTDVQLQFLYGAWRMQMWLKGYGTGYAIDAAVSRGELTPGQEYPKTDKPFPDPRGDGEDDE